MLSKATTTMKRMFISPASGRGSVFFFSLNASETSEDFGGGGGGVKKKKQIPLYPAPCVLSFRVECCCLLALQERERVKKKYCGGVYPSYVHYFSATYVLYTKKKKKKSLKKRANCGGNGNPPSVNKENSSCRFFHVLIGAAAGAPFFVLFPSLSFSLVFPRGGKGGVGGVLRSDLSIGIVFIFIKTFLLSIELLQ